MALILAIVLAVNLCGIACGSESSDPGVFKDMVPTGQKVEFFTPNLLKSFDSISILDIVSDNGLAALVVTSLLDYSSQVKSTNYDESKACYVGISLSRYASVFCEPGGEYLCIMYYPEMHKAAYYSMGTADAARAAEILRQALPNQDCRQVSKSAISYVVDALYDSLK